MGKATAKIKGAASKVGAALSGKVGVLNTLEGEHSEVASLMDDVIDADEPDKRLETFRLIRRKLLVHAQGEEQGLYLECRANDSTRAMATKAMQDHARMKELIATLDDLTRESASGGAGSRTGDEWMRTFEQLKTVVEDHVEFEEEQLFPAVKEVISADALRDLDSRYAALHKRVDERGEEFEPRVSRSA